MKPRLPDPIPFCGTDFTPTTYGDLAENVYSCAPAPAKIVDFSNTHITVLRKIDSNFRLATDSVDYFVPDSMPLTWCVNLAAGKTIMPDRVYGPEFMKRCLRDSPSTVGHYFLGASDKCLRDLIGAAKQKNPRLNVCGSHHGYFADSAWSQILEEVKNTNPQVLWLGLGTPKQQEFSAWAKGELSKVWVLNVGFAFDVNAGHKPDAPRWMQNMGLTWFFRLASEPRRLLWRYLKFNTLFLFFATRWALETHRSR